MRQRKRKQIDPRLFVECLAKALSEEEPARLESAWVSTEERTSLYTEKVIPHIARAFGLDLSLELFRIDAVLCQPTPNGVNVPIVAIESENLALRSAEEMQKLIALACPLKVLIVCCPWSEDPTMNDDHSVRPILLGTWNSYLRAAQELDLLEGDFLFVVAEWGDDDILRYYCLLYDRKSTTVSGERVLYQRKMSG